jgi:hypothetical protein
MPLCQVPKVADIALGSAANDNCKPITSGMKSFEQSVLVQRDYTKPSKRNQIGLIVSGALWASVFVVAFVVPLFS